MSYVWARFAVCNEINTVVHDQHLIYEKIQHSRAAQENCTTKGQLEWQYNIFLMNQKYAHM